MLLQLHKLPHNYPGGTLKVEKTDEGVKGERPEPVAEQTVIIRYRSQVKMLAFRLQ